VKIAQDQIRWEKPRVPPNSGMNAASCLARSQDSGHGGDFSEQSGERALCVIRKSRCKVQAQGSCSAPLHSFRRTIEKLGVILRFAAASFKISAGCG
jgi:hypothetical protein